MSCENYNSGFKMPCCFCFFCLNSVYDKFVVVCSWVDDSKVNAYVSLFFKIVD